MYLDSGENYQHQNQPIPEHLKTAFMVDDEVTMSNLDGYLW